MIATVSENNEQHAPVYRLANRVLMAIGVLLAAYVAVRLVVDW